MAEISIIVPVYNTSKYIAKCLDSLVNQTYKDLEIIIVDDGSYDDSYSLCQLYQKTDNRIKLFRQTNQGVSAARNLGLENVSGKYVMFVDSDDWIENDCCEIVLESIKNNRCDILMWAYFKEYDDNIVKRNMYFKDCFFEGKQVDIIQRKLLGPYGSELEKPENMDVISTVWGKLYSITVIKDVQFVDLSFIGTYEDGLFNISVFGNAGKIGYINQELYHYRKNNRDSIVTKYKENQDVKFLNLFSFMDDYISRNKLDETYFTALSNRKAISIFGLSLNILSSPCDEMQKIKMIKCLLEIDEYSESLKKLDMQYFPLHWKIFYKFAKQKFAIGVWGLASITKILLSIR